MNKGGKMREKRHGFFVTGTVAIIIILAQHLLVHLAFGDEGANKTSQYIFVTIDFPTPDGKFGFTNLNDINDKGEIVGGFSDILFDVQAGFLLKENFRSTDIQCPNAAFTEAETINKHGEIAGHCFAAGAGPNRSGFFRDKKGKYTFLDFPGATLIEAIGINDDGQVVGDYRDSSGTFRGFFWDAGLFLTFDVPFPGATLTGPSGINNVGQIVGFFLDADGDSRRGFLYDNGFSIFPVHDGPFLRILTTMATLWEFMSTVTW
jgi:probable HAF family extracellular repeat protein